MSNTLMQRIIGAFTFKREVYGEVERDTSFTSTAWMLVAAIALLSAIGSGAVNIATGGVGTWLIGAVVGTIFAVAGFAAACFVISWVGSSLFKADVSFEEMVRTLGLAYVWNIVGFVGILAAISATLSCVLAPALIVAAIAGLIAWFVAAKEALDLDWGQTIVTVIIGWVILLIVSAIAGAILGAMGLAAAGAMGALGGG